MMFLVGMALFGETIVTLGLYMCLYVYIFVYRYCRYMYILYIYVCVCMCIYIYMCVCVCIYIYIYIRVCVCVYYVTFMASGLRNNKHTGHAPKSEVILELVYRFYRPH